MHAVAACRGTLISSHRLPARTMKALYPCGTRKQDLTLSTMMSTRKGHGALISRGLIQPDWPAEVMTPKSKFGPRLTRLLFVRLKARPTFAVSNSIQRAATTSPLEVQITISTTTTFGKRPNPSLCSRVTGKQSRMSNSWEEKSLCRHQQTAHSSSGTRQE